MIRTIVGWIRVWRARGELEYTSRGHYRPTKEDARRFLESGLTAHEWLCEEEKYLDAGDGRT